MTAKNFNLDRAAKVLADAEILGVSRAAVKWGCTRRTVQNYRKRAANDEVFAQLYLRTLAKFDGEWQAESIRTLRVLLAMLREKAGEADFKDLAVAIEQVGGLHVAREALGVSSAEVDRPGHPTPQSPAGNGHGRAEAQLH